MKGLDDAATFDRRGECEPIAGAAHALLRAGAAASGRGARAVHGAAATPRRDRGGAQCERAGTLHAERDARRGGRRRRASPMRPRRGSRGAVCGAAQSRRATQSSGATAGGLLLGGAPANLRGGSRGPREGLARRLRARRHVPARPRAPRPGGQPGVSDGGPRRGACRGERGRVRRRRDREGARAEDDRAARVGSGADSDGPGRGHRRRVPRNPPTEERRPPARLRPCELVQRRAPEARMAAARCAPPQGPGRPSAWQGRPAHRGGRVGQDDGRVPARGRREHRHALAGRACTVAEPWARAAASSERDEGEEEVSAGSTAQPEPRTLARRPTASS